MSQLSVLHFGSLMCLNSSNFPVDCVMSKVDQFVHYTQQCCHSQQLHLYCVSCYLWNGSHQPSSHGRYSLRCDLITEQALRLRCCMFSWRDMMSELASKGSVPVRRHKLYHIVSVVSVSNLQIHHSVHILFCSAQHFLNKNTFFAKSYTYWTTFSQKSVIEKYDTAMHCYLHKDRYKMFPLVQSEKWGDFF